MLDVSGDILAKWREGDPAVTAARGFLTDTLGRPSDDNPFLDDIVSQSNDNVRNTLQARMGTRGQTGGSQYYDMIGKSLAENETGLRYNDYNNREQMKLQAAGLTPSLAAADFLALQPALQTGQMGAMLPLQASLANAAGVGGLLGQYQNVNGTQKTTQSGGLFGSILGAALGGLAGNPGIFSDRRLKTDVRRVGYTDEGTPVYTYRYQGEGPFFMGVMADEVNDNALAGMVEGFQTVNYAEVR